MTTESVHQANSAHGEQIGLYISCVKYGRTGNPLSHEAQQYCENYCHVMKKTKHVTSDAGTDAQMLIDVIQNTISRASERDITLRNIVFVTDGCASQFKCKLFFFLCSQIIIVVNTWLEGKARTQAINDSVSEEDIESRVRECMDEKSLLSISHFLHTSMNGKGEVDGHAGFVKSFVRKEELRMNLDGRKGDGNSTFRLHNAWEVFKACQDSKSRVGGLERGEKYNSVTSVIFKYVLGHDVDPEVMLLVTKDPQYLSYQQHVLWVNPKMNLQKWSAENTPQTQESRGMHEFLYCSNSPNCVFVRTAHCYCVMCRKHEWDQCMNANHFDDINCTDAEPFVFQKRQLRRGTHALPEVTYAQLQSIKLPSKLRMSKLEEQETAKANAREKENLKMVGQSVWKAGKKYTLRMVNRSIVSVPATESQVNVPKTVQGAAQRTGKGVKRKTVTHNHQCCQCQNGLGDSKFRCSRCSKQTCSRKCAEDHKTACNQEVEPDPRNIPSSQKNTTTAHESLQNDDQPTKRGKFD